MNNNSVPSSTNCTFNLITNNKSKNKSQKDAILNHRKVEVSQVSQNSLFINNTRQSSQQNKSIQNLQCTSNSKILGQERHSEAIESEDEYYDSFGNLNALTKAIKTQNLEEDTNDDVYFDALDTVIFEKEEKKSEVLVAERALSNESTSLVLDNDKNINHKVRKTTLTFEQLVDDFLSTPKEYFNPIDDFLLQKKMVCYEVWKLYRGKFETEKTKTFIFNKVTLNMLLADWLKGKITSKILRNKLYELEKTTQCDQLSCCFFMEQIFLLKQYRMVLHGEDISHVERMELNEALYDISNLMRDTKLSMFYFDVSILHILFLLNCLPSSKCLVNYDSGYNLFYDFMKEFMHLGFLFSPMSFTAFDSIRINPLNYNTIKDCINFLVKYKNPLPTISRFTGLLYSAKEHCKGIVNMQQCPVDMIVDELHFDIYGRYFVYTISPIIFRFVR